MAQGHTTARSGLPGAGLAPASAPSSFSWIPPKPPFERTTTRSPVAQLPARAGPRSRRPRARSRPASPSRRIPATRSASDSRCPSGTLPGRWAAATITRSAAGEGSGEVLLEDPRARGVGARLEDRHDAARVRRRRPGSARSAFRVSRTAVGMVGEVVVDRDAPRPCPAPPAAASRPGTRRGPRARPRGDPRRGGRGQGREGVAHVVLARRGRSVNSPRSRPRARRRKRVAPPRRAHVVRPPVGPGVERRRSRPGRGARGRISRRAGLSIPATTRPRRGTTPRSRTEGGLDRRQVGVDVGVVELDVADDRDVGQVVDELRAACRRRRCRTRRLRRRRAGPRPAGSCGRSPRARRPTRNEGSWPARSSRKARRLVVVVLPWVPATTSEVRPRMNSSASERGQAGHALLAVEDDLHLGVAARERVADHHQVRVLGDVGLRVGRADGDARAPRAGWTSAGRRPGRSP